LILLSPLEKCYDRKFFENYFIKWILFSVY